MPCVVRRQGAMPPDPGYSDPLPAAADLRKLGLIAGGGELPARVIAACREAGRPLFVLALEGFTNPDCLAEVDHAWIRLGAAGEGFRHLHAHNVQDIVMVGPVRRPSLADLRPDWRATRLFAKVGLKALGDDGLLRAVIAEVEQEGFRVIGVDQILGGHVARRGTLGSVQPDDQALADLAHGAAVARALGQLDVGQGVVVQQGIVLAAEAVEGTDAMLSRCAGLRREGPGGVLVKMCKPQQDRRADLPTVGPVTVLRAAEAGLRGIGVQAGAAVLVDVAEIRRQADALGLFVIGLTEEGTP